MYYVAIYLVRFAYLIWYNIKFEGKENVPKDESAIYASNHRTYADPPLIVLGVKRRFSFMAKEELFKNKLFAWLISSLGAFPVSRGKGDTSAIDTSVEKLKSGRNLVIFPEGTRSKDGKVGKGKTGAALVSAMSGAKVVPVGIVFEGTKLRFRSKIRVIYGKPIDPADYITDSKEPNPRELVKLKNAFMYEIKRMVEGEDAVKVIAEKGE
ncbi:MAG: 1-acyl-sn-glycerol-3-phosphate acyltransferase [Ruminococcus sp.]|nr:1-acyl-sn-glycerol-3-phosphate acyltransferase [Ruminococcus sp.]